MLDHLSSLQFLPRSEGRAILISHKTSRSSGGLPALPLSFQREAATQHFVDVASALLPDRRVGAAIAHLGVDGLQVLVGHSRVVHGGRVVCERVHLPPALFVGGSLRGGFLSGTGFGRSFGLEPLVARNGASRSEGAVRAVGLEAPLIRLNTPLHAAVVP